MNKKIWMEQNKWQRWDCLIFCLIVFDLVSLVSDFVSFVSLFLCLSHHFTLKTTQWWDANHEISDSMLVESLKRIHCHFEDTAMMKKLAILLEVCVTLSQATHLWQAAEVPPPGTDLNDPQFITGLHRLNRPSIELNWCNYLSTTRLSYSQNVF